jgi:hypothetical protein
MKVKTYKTTVYPVVLHECETWYLTLRKEGWPRVFENTVLRRIFEPKKDEVTGEKKRLYKEKLYALYSTPNIIRVIKLRILKCEAYVAII